MEHLMHQNSHNQHAIHSLEEELHKTKSSHSLDTSAEHLIKKNKTLNNYVKQALEQKTKMNTEVRETKAMYDKLLIEHEMLQKQHKNISDAYNGLQEKLVDVSEELQRQQEHDRANQIAAQQLQRQFDIKLQEIEEMTILQREILNTARDSKKQMEDLQLANSKHVEELAYLRKDKERQAVITNSIQSELKRIQSEKNASTTEFIARLQQKENEISVNSQKLDFTVTEWKAKYEQSSILYQEMSNKYSEQQRLLGELMEQSKEHSQLKVLCKEQEKKVVTQENTIDRLTAALKKQEAKVDSVTQERDSHVLTIAALQASIARAEQEKLDLQHQLQHSANDAATFEQIMVDAKQEKTVERKVLLEEIHDIRKERDRLVAESHKMNKILQDQALQVESKALELANTASTIAALRTDLLTMETTCKLLTSEKNYAEERVQLLEKRLQEADLTVANLKSSDTGKDDELEKLADHIEQLKQNEFELRQGMHAKELTIHTIDAQLKEVQDQLVQNKMQHQEQVKSFVSMIKGFKSDVAQKKKRIEELESSSALDMELSWRKQLEEERDGLKAELANCNNMLDTLRATNKKMEDKFKKNSEIVQSLEKKLTSLENERFKKKVVNL